MSTIATSPQTTTLSFDTSGLDIFSIEAPGGLTAVFAHTEQSGIPLNLGLVREQQADRVSLLELLLSAYAQGLLAGWASVVGFDEDGNELENVGEGALTV